MQMRVATFSSGGRMIAMASRLQASVADLQMQQASGAISTDYGGLGSDAGRLLNVEISIERANALSTAASDAKSRVEVMHDACGSLLEILNRVRSAISAATDALGSSGAAAISEEAQGYLEDAAALMNTQYAGRFVFAGSRTGSKPVDLDALSSVSSAPTTADTSYYQGDDVRASVRLASDDTLTFGVTASDSAFETTLRACNLLANMTMSPLDTTALTEASDLTEAAITDMTTVQTRLSLGASRLESAIDQHTNFVDQATTIRSELADVDVAQVAARLSIYQTQLEASYSAIAQVQSINLADYLG